MTVIPCFIPAVLYLCGNEALPRNLVAWTFLGGSFGLACAITLRVARFGNAILLWAIASAVLSVVGMQLPSLSFIPSPTGLGVPVPFRGWADCSTPLVNPLCIWGCGLGVMCVVRVARFLIAAALMRDD